MLAYLARQRMSEHCYTGRSDRMHSLDSVPGTGPRYHVPHLISMCRKYTFPECTSLIAPRQISNPIVKSGSKKPAKLRCSGSDMMCKWG